MTKEEALKSFEEENKDFERIFERYGYQMSSEEVSAVKETIERNKVAISALSENKGFEGMTNGEVIKALFPNMGVHVLTEDDETIYEVDVDDDNYMSFTEKFWNSPYKKGE